MLEVYLRLLFLPLLFHLIESLQHPAKVGNSKLQADFFIVLLGCTDEQLPELRINFSLFLWWELLLSCDDNTVKIIIMCLSFCLQVNLSPVCAHVFFSIDLKSGCACPFADRKQDLNGKFQITSNTEEVLNVRKRVKNLIPYRLSSVHQLQYSRKKSIVNARMVKILLFCLNSYVFTFFNSERCIADSIAIFIGGDTFVYASLFGLDTPYLLTKFLRH